MNRPIKNNDVAYIRVRVVRRTGSDGFGDFEVVPVNTLRQEIRPGRYLYAFRDEMVTVEEARALHEAARIHQGQQEQAVPGVRQAGLVSSGEGRNGGNLPPRPKPPTRQ